MTVAAEFHDEAFECEAPAPRIVFQTLDGAVPEPRPWAFGNILMHRTVTALASQPGGGKTTFAGHLAVHFGLGLPFGPWQPRETGPVLILNGEEDDDEIRRRLLATCYEAGIDPARLPGRVAWHSTVQHRGLKLVSQTSIDGYVRDETAIAEIKERVRQAKAKLLIVDPLVEFHSCPETNEGMKEIGAVLREIAVECDCAVFVAHHTAKSLDADTGAGNMASLRGGGSLAGLARFVLTLFTMSRENAKDYGIPVREAHRYVRIDGAKANMTLIQGQVDWFRRDGISLDNATPDRRADEVGVLAHVQLERIENDREERAEDVLARLADQAADYLRRHEHLSADTAVSLEALAKALAGRPSVGIKRSSIVEKISGALSPRFSVDGGEIVVTTTPRGTYQTRRVHLEIAPEAEQ